MIYFEVEFADGYSIACKGERIPTIEETAVFCSADIEKYGSVVSVTEIGYDEMAKFFDIDDIDNWPIFK